MQDKITIDLLNNYIKNDRKLFKEEKDYAINLINNPIKIPELMTPANLKPIENIFKKEFSGLYYNEKENIFYSTRTATKSKHSVQLNGVILDIIIK
jgi:hypothetical protein